MTQRETIIAGNWKMHGDPALASALCHAAAAVAPAPGVQVVVCPPAPLLAQVCGELAGSHVKVGGQDCHAEAQGAFTGDISAPMLKAVGCTHVIVGHSERRTLHGETSADVRKKAQAALKAGLTPIICIGETLAQREAGKEREIVGEQLRESLPDGYFILAYEPVWAIGSGRTPTEGDIRAMHDYITGIVKARPVLYGGSVNAANAASILAVPGVSGVLVGGASLKADEFGRIIAAAR